MYTRTLGRTGTWVHVSAHVYCVVPVPVIGRCVERGGEWTHVAPQTPTRYVVSSGTWRRAAPVTPRELRMSPYGCATNPRKGHEQRRRPSAVPTLIQVCESAPLPPTVASPHNCGHAFQSATPQHPVHIGSDLQGPGGCATKAFRTLADERASGLSSFLSRAQQLECKLFRQRTAALARDISRVLDDYECLDSICKDANRQVVRSRRECDHAPNVNASDACCVGANRIHRSFWSKGCTVVQLVQETRQ